MPGSASTRSRKASPRTSKFGTGRRRRRPATAARPAPRRRSAARRARPPATACGSVPQRSNGDATVQRRREIVARFADQVGLGDAAEEWRERRDAALLRLAADDPVDRAGKGGERLLGGVGVGRLGIVDEQHAPDAADLLHAVREAGEAAQSPRGSRPRLDAERAHRGDGGRRVLRIVRAAQRADAGEVETPSSLPPRRQITREPSA